MKKRLFNSYAAYSSSYFVFYFANGVICNILSVYLLGEGQSALNTSLIISASSLFSIVLQPLIGAANDRLKKPLVVIGATVTASAGCGLLFGRMDRFLLLFLLCGLCVSLCDGVCMLYEQMAAATPYSYGSIRIWGTIGYAVAAQTVTLAYERVSHFSVFWLFAGAMALSLLLLRLLPLNRLLTPEKPREAPAAAPRGLRAVLTNGVFLLFLALCFLFRGVFTVSSTYLPQLLIQHGMNVSGGHHDGGAAAFALRPLYGSAGQPGSPGDLFFRVVFDFALYGACPAAAPTGFCRHASAFGGDAV